LLAPASFLVSTANKELLAILLSKYAFYFILNYGDKTGAGDVMLNIQSLLEVPIPKTEENEKNDLISLVDQILLLIKNGDYDYTNPPVEQGKLEGQINQLVYDLFDFSPEEADIIENYYINNS